VCVCVRCVSVFNVIHTYVFVSLTIMIFIQKQK